jgi:hypothetical protein
VPLNPNPVSKAKSAGPVEGPSKGADHKPAVEPQVDRIDSIVNSMRHVTIEEVGEGDETSEPEDDKQSEGDIKSEDDVRSDGVTSNDIQEVSLNVSALMSSPLHCERYTTANYESTISSCSKAAIRASPLFPFPSHRVTCWRGQPRGTSLAVYGLQY